MMNLIPLTLFLPFHTQVYATQEFERPVQEVFHFRGCVINRKRARDLFLDLLPINRSRRTTTRFYASSQNSPEFRELQSVFGDSAEPAIVDRVEEDLDNVENAYHLSMPTYDFLNMCRNNNVLGLINLYSEKVRGRDSSLSPYFLLPGEILDQSPYASLKEENAATQLAILLAAVQGNVEAKVLILTHLEETLQDEVGQRQLAVYRQSLMDKIGQRRVLNNSGEELMITKTIFELDTLPENFDHDKVSVRFLVRLASCYLDKKETRKACDMFMLAGRKGSIYSIIKMYYLLLHNQSTGVPAGESAEVTSAGASSVVTAGEPASEPRVDLTSYKPALDEMLNSLKEGSSPNGYAFLLPAYEVQFGLNGKTRDLHQANALYHQAIDCNCREASYEYGEFLKQVAEALSEVERAKKNELYESAAKNYEKAGDLGLTQGFMKAIETYQILIDVGVTSLTVNSQLVEQLLFRASESTLDDTVVKYCRGRQIPINVERQIQGNYEQIHRFLRNNIDELLRAEERHQSA